MSAIAPADAKAPTERDIIRAMLRQLRDESFGTGPLAELRRMDPGAPAQAPPTLHRILARHVPDSWLHHGNLGRWTLVVHLLALAARSPAGDAPKLGEALFAAGYNEGRLTTLLQARPTDFPIVLPRMVRFLVAKGVDPDPDQLARLVLYGGHDDDRMRIARAYYRAEAKAASASNVNPTGIPA